MASTVNQIISVIAPDLASDPGLDVYVELAENQTDSCFFRSNYNYAVALRAAHMWSVNKSGDGTGGSVTSKKEGDLSVGFAVPKTTNSDLSGTSYGRQLLQLIRQGQPGISVTGDTNINGILNIC